MAVEAATTTAAPTSPVIATEALTKAFATRLASPPWTA
jgi:hypothetical protein